MVTATLGAALLAGAGIAGGTAAAAAVRHTGATTGPSTPSVPADAPPAVTVPDSALPDGALPEDALPEARLGAAGPGRSLPRGAAAALGEEHATASFGAAPVKLKPRPVPAVPAVPAALAGPAGLAGPAAPAAPTVRIVKAGALWVNPNPTARVTSCFGQRWGRLHAGVDLAAPDGTPIVAAGAGVVVRAGEVEGYGNAILIDHGSGYLTHYGHLSVIGVKVGQHVAAGEQIGDEGSTGHSTGPHLHFEVHLGYYQNPIEPTRWLHEHGVDIPGCAG